MWQKRSPRVALILLVLALALVDSCGRQIDRRTVLAKCARGTLISHQKVFERDGFAPPEPLGERTLSFRATDGRRVPIGASYYASYRPPSEDRLAVLREPSQGDWHIYVDPAVIDDTTYRELVLCLQAAAATTSSPQEPGIATIRHTNLEKLRRRYDCAKDASLGVREDGLVYFHSGSKVLVGLIHNGNALALDANALGYLSSRSSRAIPDPVSYFRGCIDRSGITLFDEFAVAVVAGDVFWKSLQDRGREQ